MEREPIIAVIGAGQTDARVEEIAERVGAALARAGARLICGGLLGVMAAACRGAKRAGGFTIGVLPGYSTTDANPWVDVPIATGLGEARNLVIVRTADAVIAVGGRYGTLTEIAFALHHGKRVVGLGSWRLAHDEGLPDPVLHASDPEEAVRLALEGPP